MIPILHYNQLIKNYAIYFIKVPLLMIYLALKTHDSGMSHQTHSPYEETLGGSFFSVSFFSYIIIYYLCRD